jgi:hypothetical protein
MKAHGRAVGRPGLEDWVRHPRRTSIALSERPRDGCAGIHEPVDRRDRGTSLTARRGSFPGSRPEPVHNASEYCLGRRAISFPYRPLAGAR